MIAFGSNSWPVPPTFLPFEPDTSLPISGLYGMARPFSPASDMMPVSEKEEERTDDYRDPWC
jgi:hypothetical protein